MTTNPAEMTEEEMMQAVAFMRSEYMRQDLIEIYNARVENINNIRHQKIPPEDRDRINEIYQKDGKTLGNNVSYYSNVRYNALPQQMQNDIKELCENTWGHYCVSSYTTSLHEAMEKYGYNDQNGLFLKASDKGASYNTARAIEYVEKNYPDAGTSLKDFPEGTTLGQALKILSERGKLPVGSMIMVESSGNTVSGRHCVMFMGFNEDGQPLFSSNNPEIKCKPNSGWANQKAGGAHPPHIINTQQIIAERQMEMERQQMQEMGLEAYYAAHQAELDAYRAYRQEHGEIYIEPRRVEGIDLPEEPVVLPEVQPVELPDLPRGSFGERLYGLLHYRRFHPREEEPQNAPVETPQTPVETQEAPEPAPAVVRPPEENVSARLTDAYRQVQGEQPMTQAPGDRALSPSERLKLVGMERIEPPPPRPSAGNTAVRTAEPRSQTVTQSNGGNSR